MERKYSIKKHVTNDASAMGFLSFFFGTAVLLLLRFWQYGFMYSRIIPFWGGICIITLVLFLVRIKAVKGIVENGLEFNAEIVKVENSIISIVLRKGNFKKLKFTYKIDDIEFSCTNTYNPRKTTKTYRVGEVITIFVSPTDYKKAIMRNHYVFD